MNDGLLRADWTSPEGIIAGTTLRDSQYELPAEPQWLNQVHGNRVVHWGSDAFDAGPPDADAIISSQPGSICVVRTADCLPVLLCSRDGSEIAAIHGGWRGLAAGIIEATVGQMNTSAGELVAWFGPAISQSAFEVGAEVREAFCTGPAASEAAFEVNDRGRWQADLYHLARERLANCGVANVFGGGLCTFADADRFYSFRRDGETGRLLSFIYRPE